MRYKIGEYNFYTLEPIPDENYLKNLFTPNTEVNRTHAILKLLIFKDPMMELYVMQGGRKIILDTKFFTYNHVKTRIEKTSSGEDMYLLLYEFFWNEESGINIIDFKYFNIYKPTDRKTNTYSFISIPIIEHYRKIECRKNKFLKLI